MTCSHCAFKTCLACKDAWHAGQSCADHQLHRNEDASRRLVAKISKLCPYLYFASDDPLTSLLAGSGCSHEFCWQCLAPHNGSDGIFARSNDVHARSCRNFAPDDSMAFPGSRSPTPWTPTRPLSPQTPEGPPRRACDCCSHCTSSKKGPASSFCLRSA